MTDVKDCMTCAHTSSYAPTGRIDFTKRVCRGVPPTPVLMPGPKGIAQVSLYTVVGRGDWCRLHEPREPNVLTGPQDAGEKKQ